MHCFGKFARRAPISRALRLPASGAMIAFRSGYWLRTLCFGSSRRTVDGARSSISASAFRQGRQGSNCIGVHRRLTIRSSRPHVVASAMCFTLRLHMSAAPPRVGLTQALGGRKTFVFSRDLLTQPLRSSFAPLPSLAAALVVFSHHAMLRIVRLARSRLTSVAFVRFGNSCWCGQCSATDTVASETPS
jgi:hypothetical protein